MNSVSLATTAALALAVSGCGALVPSEVKLRNDSPDTLTSISVNLAEKTATTDTLAPGKTVSLWGWPRRRGDIVVSFVRRGRRERYEFWYITPEIRQSCLVRIEPKVVRPKCDYS